MSKSHQHEAQNVHSFEMNLQNGRTVPGVKARAGRRGALDDNRYITNCLVTKVNMIIISRKVQLCPVSSRSQAQEGWPTSKQRWSPQLSITLTFIHLLHCLYPAGPSFTILDSGLPQPMVKCEVPWSTSLLHSSTITLFPGPWPIFFQALHLFTQTF